MGKKGKATGNNKGRSQPKSSIQMKKDRWLTVAVDGTCCLYDEFKVKFLSGVLDGESLALLVTARVAAETSLNLGIMLQ